MVLPHITARNVEVSNLSADLGCITMRSLTSFTQTQKAFAIFGVIMLVLVILALYGYFTGAWWEEIPAPPAG